MNTSLKHKRKEKKMKVKEIMSKPVITVDTNASLEEISRIMKTNNIGVLPVKSGDQVQGVITDRDIVVRAVAEGKNISKTKAGEIISKSLLTCNEDDDVDIAAKQMADESVNRLLVLNGSRKVAGLLSLGDLALRCTADPALLGKVLIAISSRAVVAK
jgi:CBS domain-containing protein